MSGTPGPGNGTHRAQITKFGDTLTLSLDEDYSGGPFTPDFNFSRSMSADLAFLNSGNSRLFFGVQSGNTTFDDLTVTVVPEPNSIPLLLLGGAGVFLLRRLSVVKRS